MGPRRDTLTLIRASFTGRDEIILQAFRASRSFRELCDHYVQCVAALDHWQRAQDPESALRRREYMELRDELGREIESWLKAMDTSSPRAGGRGL